MESFQAGSIVELTVNANAIPAGYYRYLGEEDHFLIFAVGRKILFGIAASHWAKHIRPAAGDDAPRTSPMEFLDRYYALSAASTAEPFDQSKLTFCAIDPSAMLMAA